MSRKFPQGRNNAAIFSIEAIGNSLAFNTEVRSMSKAHGWKAGGSR